MKRPALQNKQVILLGTAFQPEKFSGLSRNGPPTTAMVSPGLNFHGFFSLGSPLIMNHIELCISNSNTTELLIKECLIVSQYNYNLKDLETVD